MNRIHITRRTAWWAWPLALSVLVGALWYGCQRFAVAAGGDTVAPAVHLLAQAPVRAVAAPSLPEAPLTARAASAPPLDNYLPVHHKPAALSDQEWQVLKTQSAQAAQPDHELARQVDYMSFQKKYLAWRALPPGTEDRQRQELAQAVLDELPVKVAQGVVAAQQARQIQSEVVNATAADDSRRQRWLEAEQQRLPDQPQAAAAFQH